MKNFLSNTKLSVSVLLTFSLVLFSCDNNRNARQNQDMNEGSDSQMLEHDHEGESHHSIGNDMKKEVTVNLKGTKSDTVVNGTVKFSAKDNGKVKMKLEITVPSKAGKSVAVHIHEKGDCGDKGKNAGGHWNPTNEKHGQWAIGNYHSGDIGNIDLDQDGKGKKELESDRWSLGGDNKTNILGKAIIVHSGKDDYKSQPSGDAGSRIGCGIIGEGNEGMKNEGMKNEGMKE